MNHPVYKYSHGNFYIMLFDPLLLDGLYNMYRFVRLHPMNQVINHHKSKEEKLFSTKARRDYKLTSTVARRNRN